MESYFKTGVNMNSTQTAKADVSSPLQELSNGGLGMVVALSVFRKLIFVCVHWGSNVVL